MNTSLSEEDINKYYDNYSFICTNAQSKSLLTKVGAKEGAVVGPSSGLFVGFSVGFSVGARVGFKVGANVGDSVGP
jgi:hypothetical protein